MCIRELCQPFNIRIGIFFQEMSLEGTVGTGWHRDR